LVRSEGRAGQSRERIFCFLQLTFGEQLLSAGNGFRDLGSSTICSSLCGINGLAGSLLGGFGSLLTCCSNRACGLGSRWL